MDKMWAGRFQKALDKEADDFNSSIHFDCRMFRQDIEGSIAHAAMLARQGILSAQEGEALIAGILREHSRSLLMSGNYTSALLSCLLIDMAHASSVGRRCGGTAETVISFINDNIETDMTCRQIAKKLGYHQNHLNSVIKSACGVSLRAYINNKKTERATGLLENTSLSVTEIAYRLHKSVRQSLQTRDRSRPVRFQKTSVRKNHRRLTEQNNPLPIHGQGTCH